MWGLGLMLFLLGLMLAIVAPMGKRKNSRCNVEVPAILTNIGETETSESSPITWYTYSYNVNGAEYKTRSTNCAARAHEVGDKCTIWINPDKPQEAMPVRLSSNKLYTILFITGIVMIPLGILLILAGQQ